MFFGYHEAMIKHYDALLLIAQIDRMRDELRSAEEEVSDLVGKANRGYRSDEDIRRIGERERLAAELKSPLAKAVTRLRTQVPDFFREWVERNRQSLQRVILEELCKARPEIKTLEEGLGRIAQDAKYTTSDLNVLRLAGLLDEWKDLLSNKRQYALNPPSWEAWPKSGNSTFEIRGTLPIPDGIAARHPDILCQADWKSCHQGLVFLAETLSILDQGKSCAFSRESSAKSPTGDWHSSWTLTTGSLSLTLHWGERCIEGSPKPESFSNPKIMGLLPGERFDWNGSLGSESSGLSITVSGIREDRSRTIEALARCLFNELKTSF